MISQYDYANDALGRRTSMTRSGTLMATSGEALAYGYNARSELTSAVSDSDTNYNYAYAFDNIGNRQSASGAGTASTYTTNSLNQYSEILRGEATLMSLAENPSSGNSFIPEYDADGNATKIRTSTGTWNITYNAENRPVRWENTDTGTLITMVFDSQGRRIEYRSETNGVQNSWLRFFYKDYLCVQVLYSNAPYNVYKEFLWDPTEPVATRPLWFKYAGKNLFYAHDGNKNVSDLFYWATQNGVGAHYDYAPFGAITRTAKSSSLPTDILNENPFRFSSEYYDSELGLVYYNYRHYSPTDGRFLSRDPIAEQGGWNLYAFVGNRLSRKDFLGLLYNPQKCKELIEEIERVVSKLELALSKYDPIEDGKGGHPYNHGKDFTKPGGHYKKIKENQNSIKNKLDKWKSVCDDDKNDPPCSPPYPEHAKELSEKSIPEPVFPQSNLWDIIEQNSYRMGEEIFYGMQTGLLVALAAGQLGPQIGLPEEVLTLPIAIVIGGAAGFINSITSNEDTKPEPLML